MPVLGAWRTVKPINNPIWLLERNPYYYAVDTDGNLYTVDEATGAFRVANFAPPHSGC